jgi:hypothetical protein
MEQTNTVTLQIPTLKETILNAMKVIALTPHIRTYLEANDPKALKQLETAIAIAEPGALLLALGYDEMYVLLRALQAANDSEATLPADRTPLRWIAERLLPQAETATLARAEAEKAKGVRR